MSRDDFAAVRRFFDRYTDEFITRHSDNFPYVLKKEHSCRVCANMEILGREQNLGRQEMLLARTVALLHDIGRFSQYETWHTFSDPVSVDHGELGAEEIQRLGILNHFPGKEHRAVLAAVKYHNVRFIPEDLEDKSLFLTRLVRDADKIDILRVLVGQYLEIQSGAEEKNGFITHGRADDGRISDELAGEVLQGRSLDSRRVKSLNDLKLLHLSWLFDLNFGESVRIIHEKGYLMTILDTLPQAPVVLELKAAVNRYVAEKIAVQTIEN